MSFDFFLPLLTFPDPTDKAALRRGLDLAATLGGRVTVQLNELDVRNIGSALGDMLLDLSAMIATAERRSQAAADDLAEEAEIGGRRLRLPLVSRRVRGEPESLPDRISAAARISDFCILPESGDLQASIAEAVLFGSGGPVLLLPTTDTAFHLQVAAIAWDGSRAAARAVRDALPILARAKKVVVLTVTDDKAIDATSNGELAEHLRYRGVHCEFTPLKRDASSVGECLQEASLAAGAGLLVMGAYGHNRLREWVLGGATKELLAHRRLTILMSH